MAFCSTAHQLSPSLGSSPSSQHRVATQSLADPTSSSCLSTSCSSCSSTPRPDISSWSLKSKTLSSLSKTLAFSVSSGLLFHFSSTDHGPGNSGPVDGGGGGGDWGWNRNGGGDGGNFWSRLFSPSAIAGEDEFQSQEWDTHGLPANIVVQLNKLSGFKKYKISEILFFDLRRSTTVGTEDSLFETVSLRPGDIYTKAHLQKEIKTLATCGVFNKVDMEGKTKPDGTLGITISFAESTWRSADSFRCINVGLLPPYKPVEMDPDMTEKEKLKFFRNQMKDYKRRIERARPCLLPLPVEREVTQMLWEHGKISARLLRRIRDRVEKWYDDEGYVRAQVVNFGNLNTKEVVCEVVEGDITQSVVQFQDKLGNVCEGNTHLGVVRRELPKQLQRGHVFNREAVKQAVRNLKSLALFSNIKANTQADEKNEGGIIVEIKLKEIEQMNAQANMEWNIVPGRQGGLTLASIQPSVTVSYKRRNIDGLNRSILGLVTTDMDDLFFTLDYVHPYLDGVYDPRNRSFCGSCFNSRKLSPVFTGGPSLDRVLPIWVDRAGIKANITESFTHQSKLTYGLVMEQITMHDGNGHITVHGQRELQRREPTVFDPPTTLSGTGIDRMVFAQANITHDNTKFVNGAVVGDRDVFQEDQGLGIGSKFPFFNRQQLTITRFIQLKQVEEGAGKPPPPVLVLHGHYGRCVGDLPSYDAFILGGPYSVRGYNMGELGACRNILELAAELRIPVRNTHVYAFAEHGNDLGSSKDVKGNPTEYYRRAGQGSSYGIGVKLGSVRAEYTVNHNTGTGAVSLRYGERF